MRGQNIASVSWGDHLVFGEGDGQLASPEALQRRIRRWRDELGATTIHWRELRSRLNGHYHAARGVRHPAPWRSGTLPWDDLQIVPGLAHEAELEAYIYVTIFDEGRPLLPKKVREVSYHNAMHGRHVSWQSAFTHDHPDLLLLDKLKQTRQWGVPCLAYPDVRTYFRDLFCSLLHATQFDGLFICLRSQSRPADFADQFGFNDPIRNDYLARCNRDIWTEDFDLQTWRDLCGEYLTRFLAELRAALSRSGRRLAVGVPRGDILGPPLGNQTLDWRNWVTQNIIDDLVINQNSSKCPSSWLDLWPMHRGYGYLQNYLDGRNMPPLKDQLINDYGPALSESEANLFISRQWDEGGAEEESELTSFPQIKGLAFSTFRFDNPGPIERNAFWA